MFCATLRRFTCFNGIPIFLCHFWVSEGNTEGQYAVIKRATARWRPWAGTRFAVALKSFGLRLHRRDKARFAGENDIAVGKHPAELFFGKVEVDLLEHGGIVDQNLPGGTVGLL